MSLYIKKFINQASYEKIIYFLRADVIILIKQIILFIFLLALPFLADYFLQTSFPEIFENTTVFPLIVLLASVYFLTVWLVFFLAFIDYYLDFWIVTNDRIINVSQHFFSRTISELDLYKIQDITVEIKGFLPTMFDYGKVYIQTAGARGRFVFDDIPNPREVARKIMELAEIDSQYHTGNKEPRVSN
jgi:uncharacterized membrane protein YdbT with pleckstrin-like domain